jgi:dTDP-4-amino-4,6-dideoxygalactose transaminase
MCAINLKRGDKVLCSVNSSPAIPEVVRHFDAEPIFIDIEKDSMNLDFAQLRDEIKRNVSKKLKAIVVSHVDGKMIDIEEVKKIVSDRDLYIVEDATNSIGLNRDKVDGIADIRIFGLDDKISNLGIFATDNEDIFERANLLKNHGIVYDEDTHIENYIYDVVDTGCQYEASKLSLLYSIKKLELVSERINRKREIAKMYISGLEDLNNISFLPYSSSTSYSKFIININKNRDGFAKELFNLGIETELLYIPLHLFSYYKNKYDLKVNSFPNALLNYQQALSIPIHHELSDDDVEYIIESIRDIALNRA